VNDNEPRLYILMRTDLLSLNPGKAVAQGSHAATKFLYDMEQMRKGNHRVLNKKFTQYQYMMRTWMGKRGFGTKITLGIKGPRLETLIENLKQEGYPAGLVVDPSYPLRDGETTHLFPLTTCGYVFGMRDELASTDISCFGLMP
jgi:hypothetical protein